MFSTRTLKQTLSEMDDVCVEKLGVVVVDHGSRRAESNALLLDVAKLFGRVSEMKVIEPAHMELAEPTIAQAFTRCVQRGAELVVVFPYFLSPGRHWSQDIPALAAEAAAAHPGVRYLVTAPLGLHELLAQVMGERIAHCLAQANGAAEPCDLCREAGGCTLHLG
ncbi:CbiX/SirB N-terminal domain-containing protein [Pseudobythopirellula maris]|nr:CbiX/SirB N-terminal domain-containing protein [Pseudobythopirellula maris]